MISMVVEGDIDGGIDCDSDGGIGGDNDGGIAGDSDSGIDGDSDGGIECNVELKEPFARAFGKCMSQANGRIRFFSFHVDAAAGCAVVRCLHL